MPITSYESEQDRIKRAIAEALALRGDNEQPQGRMVSGHFVAPSWIEQLNPVINQALGGYKQGKAEREQKELASKIETEHGDWMKSRPRTTYEEITTSEEVPGTVAPGPQMEAPGTVVPPPDFRGPMPEAPRPGPLMKTRMVSERREVEPSDEAQIDWASKGLRNPLSKTIASKYMEDQLVQAPERRLAREFKADEASKARIAKSEMQQQQHRNKLVELNLLSMDKTKTREQLGEIERMKDATRRAMNTEDAQAKIEAAQIKAKAAGVKVTPTAPRVIHDLSEAKTVAEGVADSFATFKPEYAGISGFIDKMSGKFNPFSSKEADAAAAWWNRYELQAALVERHAKFGTALSASERQAWTDATIKDLTNPQLVAQNLKKRAELTTKFYNNLRNQYIQGGHGLVDAAFDPITESFMPDQGGGAAPPTVLPRVQTPQAAPARPPKPGSFELPPGVTITPRS